MTRVAGRRASTDLSVPNRPAYSVPVVSPAAEVSEDARLVPPAGVSLNGHRSSAPALRPRDTGGRRRPCAPRHPGARHHRPHPHVSHTRLSTPGHSRFRYVFPHYSRINVPAPRGSPSAVTPAPAAPSVRDPAAPATPAAPRFSAAPTRTVYWSACRDNPCKRSTEPLYARQSCCVVSAGATPVTPDPDVPQLQRYQPSPPEPRSKSPRPSPPRPQKPPNAATTPCSQAANPLLVRKFTITSRWGILAWAENASPSPPPAPPAEPPRPRGAVRSWPSCSSPLRAS
jgi:hypothetical protein